MTMKRATVFIKRLLYNLERRMGGRVSFHRDVETLNTRTGKKTVAKTVWQDNKVVVLPSELKTKFVFDLSFIAANKNFTYGGDFDTSKRRLILSAREAGDYVPQNQDYFVFEGKRWELDEIQTFEYNTGYLLVGSEVKGAPVQQQVSMSVLQYGLFSDEVEGVL